MADDQQFCLRWNNHQSTLISVFDTLLENGTLVDCTLAAEGQSLKAHKVVLSACSPYLETLLSEHYEKHPIIIMKDVKFTELKSMMDYMYRGEVNICQDQLGTFLKAAESLQIKGLSENGEGDARDVGSTTRPPPPKRPPATPAARTDPEQPPAASPAHRPRDGSISPSSRKRRRTRRNSDDANHFDSNSCDLPLTPAQSTPVVPHIPASITSTPIRTPVVKPELNDRLDHNSLPPESGLLKEKIEPAEQLLEPKTEYLEDLNNDDSVEDLTLDDDDEMDMSQMSNMSNMSRPGPSHGTDISNQGFSPWQLGNQSGGNDEVFMAAQEAVNSHRDSQDSREGLDCLNCNQTFASQARLVAHLRQVSRSSSASQHCFLCDYLSANPEDLTDHLHNLHPEQELNVIFVCQECNLNFKTEEDTVCHLRTCERNQTLEEELAEFVDIAEDDAEHCYAKQSDNTQTPEKISQVTTTERCTNVTKLAGEDDERLETVEALESILRDTKKPAISPESALHKIFHFFNTKSLEEIKKGYKCPDCGKVYTSYFTAKGHLNNTCNKEPDKLCELCGYKSRLITNLRRHMKLVHKAPQKYVCDQCGKVFKKKHVFTHHTRYDCSSSKPYKCHRCDFETKIPGILNSHLFKTHNELKPPKTQKPGPMKDIPDPIKVSGGHQCPDCHHVFQVTDSYKRHRLLSCGRPRSVKCLVETCEYTTTNHYNLKMHMKRVHYLYTRCKQYESIEVVDTEKERSDT